MARAKTTYRADARRRYRAARAAEMAELEAAELEAAELEAAEAETGDEGTRGPAAPRAATSAPPTGSRARTAAGRAPAGDRASGSTAARPSLLTALRVAAAPADVRADIRAFPAIARTSRAVWVPALLDVAAFVALVISAVVDAPLMAFLGSAVLTPPMIPAFLAGMLAPRAAWLAGGVAGVIGSVLVSLYIAVAPATGEVDRVAYIGSALLTGILFSFGVGAFAGFYRRFLALSSPAPRQRRPATKGRSKGR